MQRLLAFHPLRLFTVPEVRVADGSPRRSRLAVDGLVCGVCARRAGRALAGVDGVRKATVDLARGEATIEHELPPDPAALQRAIERVVLGMGWRRRLARWARSRGGA